MAKKRGSKVERSLSLSLRSLISLRDEIKDLKEKESKLKDKILTIMDDGERFECKLSNGSKAVATKYIAQKAVLMDDQKFIFDQIGKETYLKVASPSITKLRKAVGDAFDDLVAKYDETTNLKVWRK